MFLFSCLLVINKAKNLTTMKSNTDLLSAEPNEMTSWFLNI